MLVSAKQTLVTPTPKRPGDEPTADAASGLQSTLVQHLQNTLQMQTFKNNAGVEASTANHTTQQVSAASKISDNVDEAFAKTRVTLQATDTSTTSKSTDSSAMADFKDYMSKSPEQRLHDSILQEMGLTEDEVKAMPPEKQLAIGKEIAQRMEDKLKLAKTEKEDSSSDKSGSQVVDKFLASL
ncbi:hypothetical protein EJA72_20975 [Pseudomonas sp. PB120]|uniref:hypothetical protein n=1 Tax=Pseudomonas sp. PB120 TaxID=2494700 RepID=UPI0012FE41B9|nr:hypothetical protein [Pseudomonas sp. PB120]MVV50689.1 hypothetical protein [Pseudomonas sp. PB120]